MSLISFLLVAFFCIYELTHGSLLLLIVTVHGIRGIENLSLLVSTNLITISTKIRKHGSLPKLNYSFLVSLLIRHNVFQ